MELVEETKTGNMFALKALSKGYAAWTRQHITAVIEKRAAGRGDR